MEQVKTAEGVIDCPNLEDIGPRTKYWASVIRDVVRTEEMYMVMGAALEEAYRAGAIGAMARFMEGLGKMGEVIDVEAKEVGDGGSERTEPAEDDSSGGPVEPTAPAPELPGSDPEGTECVGGDAEKVEEGPWHVGS